MTIHAQHPSPEKGKEDEPLCVYFFKSWCSERARKQKRTIRYRLVRCATCRALMARYPQLANRAHAKGKEQGETGTLDAQAGSDEAKAYWSQAQKEGRKVPRWARILYFDEK